jgi:uncharacterized protein YcbK (DUF882 family)
MKKKISIEDYRKITNDYKTQDNLIEKRLSYLESFCRNIIRTELNRTVNNKIKI